MRSVTYAMGASLDGYIVGPDGRFDWTAPDKEVFRFWIDEIREVGVHLMGRRLYETMLFWETADQNPSLDEAELEWAALWNPLPKVVFSTTLSAVQGKARLASGGLAEEIERLRAEPGDGDIAIGGATLAAEAAALDLIDEYRAMVYPVLVGGGHSVLPAARAPGGSRARRDPHLQLERRLPPLPRGEIAGSICWRTAASTHEAGLRCASASRDQPGRPSRRRSATKSRMPVGSVAPVADAAAAEAVSSRAAVARPARRRSASSREATVSPMPGGRPAPGSSRTLVRPKAGYGMPSPAAHRRQANVRAPCRRSSASQGEPRLDVLVQIREGDPAKEGPLPHVVGRRLLEPRRDRRGQAPIGVVEGDRACRPARTAADREHDEVHLDAVAVLDEVAPVRVVAPLGDPVVEQVDDLAEPPEDPGDGRQRVGPRCVEDAQAEVEIREPIRRAPRDRAADLDEPERRLDPDLVDEPPKDGRVRGQSETREPGIIRGDHDREGTRRRPPALR